MAIDQADGQNKSHVPIGLSSLASCAYETHDFGRLSIIDGLDVGSLSLA